MRTKYATYPEPLTRPKAYSYIRISSLMQREGDGERRQTERAAEYATKHGLDLDTKLTFADLGVSASRGAHRTIGALGRFLEAVHEGRIAQGSVLIIEALDRFSRENPMEIVPEFIKLLNARIDVVTLVDGLRHTLDEYRRNPGMLMISIVKFAAAHDENERKKLRQEENWVKKRRDANAGIIVTRRCPAWLKVVENETREIIGFEPIKERVDTVRWIFEQLASGVGRGTIARMLNQNGIANFGHGKRGWHGGTVQHLTTNRAVLGEYLPNKLVTVELEMESRITGSDGVTRTEVKKIPRIRRQPAQEPIKGYYPQIITNDLWVRAHKSARQRRVELGDKYMPNAGGRTGKHYSNLFRQVGRCETCGDNMVYKPGGPRQLPALRCSRHLNRLCANDVKITYERLERSVLTFVRELDLSGHLSEEGKAMERDLGLLTRQRDDHQKRLDNLVNEFAGEGVRSVADMIRKLQAQIDETDKAIAKLQERVDDLVGALDHESRKKAVQDLLERMGKTEGFEKFTIRARVAMTINEIVDRMVFTRSGTVFLVIRNSPRLYEFKSFDQPIQPCDHKWDPSATDHIKPRNPNGPSLIVNWTTVQ